MDISHRGGRPGFVQVSGNELIIPDFSGNRYFNTFGNLLIEPRASLLFIDFDTGDVLRLKGIASIDWNPRAHLQPEPSGSGVLMLRLIFRQRSALPLRWDFAEFSPASLATGVW